MPCYSPMKLPVKHKPIIQGGKHIWGVRTLPCGTCIGCRAKQAREWAIRIMHETEMHDESWFVTLTYSNETLPENGTLYPKHLRTFFKNLRRDKPQLDISYYACGEYGDTTQRPHYHAVVYGLPLLDKCSLPTRGPNPLWRSETLESYWPHGLSEFSTVTPGSAAYVAGYVRKKVTKKANPDHYIRVDPDTGELIELEKEFSRMSLRPAIGKRWIEKYWADVYPRDFVVMNGREFKPPRYYDKWMDENHPEIMLQTRIKRDEEAKNIPESKLRAAEKIHQARSQLYETRGKV